MSSHPEKTIFSNDAEITFLKASDGVTDTTRRPASGANLKMALEQLEKEAKFRRLMEQKGNTEAEARPTDTDSK
jgi:hypothetical protein